MPILPTPKYDPYRRTFFDTARQANRSREEIEASDVYIRKDVDDSTANNLSIGSASPPSAVRLYVQEGLDADANDIPGDPIDDGVVALINGDAGNDTLIGLLCAATQRAGLLIAGPETALSAKLVWDRNAGFWEFYAEGNLILKVGAGGLYLYFGGDEYFRIEEDNFTASFLSITAGHAAINDADVITLEQLTKALDGTGPVSPGDGDPRVKCIQESSGPTDLAISGIPDTYLLARDGTDIIGIDPSTVGGSGVTSVGLSLPVDMTVTGSPITSTGTLAITRVKPRWDVLEPPASAHAKDIEFTQGFSSDVAGTPTGLTDDDQGSIMSPSSTKWGYTMLHDGTANRTAGGYVTPPTSGTNGVFTCYARVSMGVERVGSGRFAVGLQIIEDTTITTARRRGLYIMQQTGEGSMTHTTHSAYNATPSIGTTHDYFGSGIVRFVRDYVAGTAYWTYSLSLDGESWYHFHQTTELWTIGRIGPYVWTDPTSAGKTHTGYCKFLRFLDVADYFSPCPGRWIV